MNSLASVPCPRERNSAKIRLGFVSVVCTALMWLGCTAPGHVPSTKQGSIQLQQFDLATDEQALAGIRELARRNDEESNAALLGLAMGRTMFPTAVVQAAAIVALGQNGYHPAAEDLPDLLVPHYALDVRLAAADALLAFGCDISCTRSVMSHLESIHGGECDAEQVRRARMEATSVEFGTKIGPDPAIKKRKELVKQLERVVEANWEPSLNVLVRHYGLESSLPSLFALDLLTRVKLSNACEVLPSSSASVVWWEQVDLAILVAATAHQGCSIEGN